MEKSLELFDKIFKLNSEPAKNFLQECEKNIDFEKAVKLMQWYEHLVSEILYKKSDYDKFCLELSKQTL